MGRIAVAAVLALSLLAGAGQASADPGDTLVDGVCDVAPESVSDLGVTWE